MESKKAQKLSKAAVATVLATSGILVAMPHPTNAYSFSDLNPLADYYEPVVDLANRKIASGYSDGTFKPNKAITREDAAKMLALTIDVNIKNPKNPGFKDVKASNPNYRYIAALAEAGIINGYSDGTFKPKEPITRGQMAKILTLGFKFGVSTKLTHGFKDVSSKNANAYFIQTLYDLKITKGKTPISFDPFNTVTRGQMATFIWRAEKADRGKPVYAVGDIIGDQIYINGVAHTIAPHLRSILSVGNKNILKGAYIEGDFSGNRINNISKLTINASGTSSRLLAMNGNNTSFAGELVVNGSYLRFKNITFTGRVEVAEAPRRSLANLSQVRVANIGTFANFIDWGESTDDKNEDQLNPDDNETLVDKPDPSKPITKYKDRMPNLKKYVDFEDSDIRHLYVTADRTFLKANYEIDRLYVERDVSNFELYADPNAMYIDTDYNLNVYGVHDIRYLYKNTLKNVHLKSDATYDYYYITSSNGFTNLGEFAYITNAIIPIGKTVNDVFDDFYTDEPQIGHIEDEDGKEVSRDPVGDTVIKDMTAPKITQLTATAGGTVADITLKADEDGTYYYVVKRADEKPPTINEIKTGGTSGPIIMDEPVKFQVQGLETMTDYVIYAIVIDGDDNVSEKEEAAFSTIDNKPPTFNLTPTNPQPAGGKRLEFTFEKISEPGTIYYYIRQVSSQTAPAVEMSADEIIKNPTATVTATKPGNLTETARIHGAKPNTAAIEPNTPYDVYAVMVDSSGNKMRVVERKRIVSAVPDEEHPFLKSNVMMRESENSEYFYIEVNEKLDKETAENIANYTLSGSGIVTIYGKPKITPEKVEFIEKSNHIRIKIPSVSSLVHNDTIRVTISKNVLDRAENEFESIDTYDKNKYDGPRNTATYLHGDPIGPKIEVQGIDAGINTYLVDLFTTKAGTYYYMILPSDYDISGKGITSRDFVDEFSMNGEYKSGKFQTNNKNDYHLSEGTIVNQQGPVESGLNKLKPISKPTTLSMHERYSIYFVVRDRSGHLSEIKESKLLFDTKPPLVTSYSVDPVEGYDDRINIKLDVNESGKLHVIPVPKYVDGKLNDVYFTGDGKLKPLPADIFNTTKTNDELRKIFRDFGGKYTKPSVSFGTNNEPRLIEGLKPHEEYGMYIAVEDNIGNFTVLKRQDTTTTPIPENEPAGDVMVHYFYTDGIQPHIANEGVIVRNGDPRITTLQPTFTITFNEAIMRYNDSNGLVKYNTSLIPSSGSFDLSSIMEIEDGDIDNYEFVSYTVGELTTSESKLVIRPKAGINAEQTIKVKMKTNSSLAYDYQGLNGFGENSIGKYYRYRVGNNVWNSATLINKVGNAWKGISLNVALNIEFKETDNPTSNLKQRYYYAVGNAAHKEARLPHNPYTADEILAAIHDNEPLSGVVNYGYKEIVTGEEQSGLFEPQMNLNLQTTFNEGDVVYLFTKDKYGNIIWAMDGSVPYIEIKPPTP